MFTEVTTMRTVLMYTTSILRSTDTDTVTMDRYKRYHAVHINDTVDGYRYIILAT